MQMFAYLCGKIKTEVSYLIRHIFNRIPLDLQQMIHEIQLATGVPTDAQYNEIYPKMFAATFKMYQEIYVLTSLNQIV